MFDIELFLRGGTVPNSYPHFNRNARLYIFPLLDQISFIVRNSYTNKEILIIALDCGFYDAAHFNRKFKFSNGCSPSDYRKKHQTTIDL